METRECRKRASALTWLLIALLLMSLSGFSGCVTQKVLELRKERETRTREKTNFWSLHSVTSAHVVAGSDAFACVQFRDSPSDSPKPFTINLTQASHNGKTFADFMPAGQTRTASREAPRWLLYPLENAQNGCAKDPVDSPFPVVPLKVERALVRPEDQPEFLKQLLLPFDGGGRVVEIRPTPDAGGTSSSEDVLLVYLPVGEEGEQVRMIAVAGAFEPGSEWVNPYTLLVVPALATDTAMVTMAIMVVGAAYGGRR